MEFVRSHVVSLHWTKQTLNPTITITSMYFEQHFCDPYKQYTEKLSEILVTQFIRKTSCPSSNSTYILLFVLLKSLSYEVLRQKKHHFLREMLHANAFKKSPWDAERDESTTFTSNGLDKASVVWHRKGCSYGTCDLLSSAARRSMITYLCSNRYRCIHSSYANTKQQTIVILLGPLCFVPLNSCKRWFAQDKPLIYCHEQFEFKLTSMYQSKDTSNSKILRALAVGQ